MVDPTQEQQDNYEFLLKVQEEIMSKLKHGQLKLFKFDNKIVDKLQYI